MAGPQGQPGHATAGSGIQTGHHVRHNSTPIFQPTAHHQGFPSIVVPPNPFIPQGTAFNYTTTTTAAPQTGAQGPAFGVQTGAGAQINMYHQPISIQIIQKQTPGSTSAQETTTLGFAAPHGPHHSQSFTSANVPPFVSQSLAAAAHLTSEPGSGKLLRTQMSIDEPEEEKSVNNETSDDSSYTQNMNIAAKLFVPDSTLQPQSQSQLAAQTDGPMSVVKQKSDPGLAAKYHSVPVTVKPPASAKAQASAMPKFNYLNHQPSQQSQPAAPQSQGKERQPAFPGQTSGPAVGADQPIQQSLTPQQQSKHLRPATSQAVLHHSSGQQRVYSGAGASTSLSSADLGGGKKQGGPGTHGHHQGGSNSNAKRKKFRVPKYSKNNGSKQVSHFQLGTQSENREILLRHGFKRPSQQAPQQSQPQAAIAATTGAQAGARPHHASKAAPAKASDDHKSPGVSHGPPAKSGAAGPSSAHAKVGAGAASNGREFVDR